MPVPTDGWVYLINGGYVTSEEFNWTFGIGDPSVYMIALSRVNEENIREMIFGWG